MPSSVPILKRRGLITLFVKSLCKEPQGCLGVSGVTPGAAGHAHPGGGGEVELPPPCAGTVMEMAISSTVALHLLSPSPAPG